MRLPHAATAMVALAKHDAHRHDRFHDTLPHDEHRHDGPPHDAHPHDGHPHEERRHEARGGHEGHEDEHQARAAQAEREPLPVPQTGGPIERARPDTGARSTGSAQRRKPGCRGG
ncbi:hypothetical protein Ddc_20456 [Ditylenchus destructor]|nr:hypothetical protein Ddc_20456 [Ditylenchus destructor]